MFLDPTQLSVACSTWVGRAWEWVYITRYTHAHHVPHAEHVERSDEMVKCSRDYVEDFEDVSGMLSSACPVHSSVSEVKPRF